MFHNRWGTFFPLLLSSHHSCISVTFVSSSFLHVLLYSSLFLLLKTARLPDLLWVARIYELERELGGSKLNCVRSEWSGSGFFSMFRVPHTIEWFSNPFQGAFILGDQVNVIYIQFRFGFSVEFRCFRRNVQVQVRNLLKYPDPFGIRFPAQ